MSWRAREAFPLLDCYLTRSSCRYLPLLRPYHHHESAAWLNLSYSLGITLEDAFGFLLPRLVPGRFMFITCVSEHHVAFHPRVAGAQCSFEPARHADLRYMPQCAPNSVDFPQQPGRSFPRKPVIVRSQTNTARSW